LTRLLRSASLRARWLTPELHAGTVTFLFTDIEGSTRLLKTLGGGYSELLDEHQRILRAAFAAHGGRQVDSQGDSFFVAFRTAKEAVAAAVDAQRDVEAHPWPEGVRVRVRMGLHTGEPKVGGERYVGIGVHRAARIGAAGHGGQVLLSSTTKELAEEDLPPGVAIRDLGERRLKDLDQRQRLYQLEIEGLPSKFSPLRTLDVELKRKRRRRYAGAALIGAAAAAVALPIFALGQGSSGQSSVKVVPNSVAVIDPKTNRVSGDVTVGARPAAIAYGSGSVWVANLDDQTVSRIDPATSSKIRDILVPRLSGGLAAGPGAVWAMTLTAAHTLDGSPTVTAKKIDPRYNAITNSIRLQTGYGGPAHVPPPTAVAVGKGALWVGPPGGRLTRIAPVTNRARTIETGNNPISIAVGEGGVWAGDVSANNVVRIDPATNLPAAPPITVGHAPTAIAAGAGAIWVTDRFDDAVVHIDPANNATRQTVQLRPGTAPDSIAVGDGAVWVANRGDGTVSRIDPATDTVVKTITVGGSPRGVVVAKGRVWVSVQQALPRLAAVKLGGTLRVVAQRDVDFIDPALALGADPIEQAIAAKLLNYPDNASPGVGQFFVPEVAAALPRRSADGKTFTFTIRKGFRFSPPSNAAVTAQTFKDSIERTLNPGTKSFAADFVTYIAGEKSYLAGTARHISGITVRGDELTIRLTQPRGDFLAWIASSFFAAVPSGTPIDRGGVRTISSAGPYYVSSYIPGQGIVLKRNPNYGGARPHHLQEIDFTPNVPQAKALAEIEAGRVDYSLNGPPPDQAKRLAARYGPDSKAAKAGRQRYFVGPVAIEAYLILNTSRPLFANVRMRRAVNYAIDRRALKSLYGLPGEPTDQYLPRALPGFRDVHVYPFVPDVVRARRLAGSRHRTAVLYTGNDLLSRNRATIIRSSLSAIGIRVVVKTFADAGGAEAGKKGAPFDIVDGGWAWDYFDPSDFLNVLLDGRSIRAAGNENQSYFDDPAYNRRLEAASKLTGTARYRAYAKLDADLTRHAAPMVAVGSVIHEDFYSARTGCQAYAPVPASADLAALCIRGQR
jgi:YVTN family beta-propeller protein